VGFLLSLFLFLSFTFPSSLSPSYLDSLALVPLQLCRYLCLTLSHAVFVSLATELRRYVCVYVCVCVSHPWRARMCLYLANKKVVVLAFRISYAELRSSTIRFDVKNYSFQCRLFPMRECKNSWNCLLWSYSLTLMTSLLQKISLVFWELQFRKLLLSMCLSESFTKCRIKWEDGHFLRVTLNFIFTRKFCYRELFFEIDYRVSLSLSLDTSCRDLNYYYLTIYT